MKHYHIIITNDYHRERGALTLTEQAALEEKAIEEEGHHQAKIQECHQDCFASRASK